MAQPDSPLLIVLYYLVYLSVLIRMLLNGGDTGNMEPPAYALMGFFLVLSVVQPPLGRRWPVARHITLALQTMLVIALLLTTPRMDFYAMLFVAMSIFAVHDLPDRAGLIWIGVFCLFVVIGLIVAFGERAPGFLSSYIAGCLLIALYGRAVRKAEAARARSEALLVELGQANRRLHAYAERAEEAAAAQERAHLARELHDAATQTVFSMNLTAEAARIALQKEPEKAPALIDTLQDLARDALAEMRTLVRELRPGSVVDEGLVKSLEKLAALRKKRDGLSVMFTVRGEEGGSTELKETVYRTAREALNNVAKHAGVKESRLDLSFGSKEIALLVQDSGRGFDPAAAGRSESFGLIAMRERVEALGGSLVVRSAAGAGTEIEARVPVAREGEGERGQGRPTASP
jgi:signal transduction histidine kinase